MKPSSVLFTGADHVRLARLAKKRGESQAAVLRAGLDALEAGGEPTPEEALRVLSRIVRANR